MSSHVPSDRAVPVLRDAAAGQAVTRTSIAVGFGSPADDSGVTRLDLNDVLVRHPQATFLMRVVGEAMREAGIHSGDLLLIDRAIAPVHGHVVIAIVDDEFVCRHLLVHGDDVRLRAADPAAPDIVAHDGQALQLWGVVTHAITSMPA